MLVYLVTLIMFLIKIWRYRFPIAYSAWECQLHTLTAIRAQPNRPQARPSVGRASIRLANRHVVSCIVLCILFLAIPYALAIGSVTLVSEQFSQEGTGTSVVALLLTAWIIQPWSKSTGLVGRLLEALFAPSDSAESSSTGPHPSAIWISSREQSLGAAVRKARLRLRRPYVVYGILPCCLALAASWPTRSIGSLLVCFLIGVVALRVLIYTSGLVGSCWCTILVWYAVAPPVILVLSMPYVWPYVPGITQDVPLATLLCVCTVGIWSHGAWAFDETQVKLVIKGTATLLNVLGAFSIIYLFIDGTRIFPPGIIEAASTARIDDRSLFDFIVKVITFPFVLAALIADFVWEVRTARHS